ncbi:MAG: hypothetical protein WCK68_00020 [Betaproteobacteria bacterium]|jgi:hypothetical protein
MKHIIKAFIVFSMFVHGVANSETWSTNPSNSASFKASRHGWEASSKEHYRPFAPIQIPKVIIVPSIRVYPHNHELRERDYGYRYYNHRPHHRRDFR